MSAELQAFSNCEIFSKSSVFYFLTFLTITEMVTVPKFSSSSTPKCEADLRLVQEEDKIERSV